VLCIFGWISSPFADMAKEIFVLRKLFMGEILSD